MKKFTIGILFLSSIIYCSCNKEKSSPLIDDREQFKYLTKIQFSGQVLGNNIYWIFDNWENGIGSCFGSCWCLTDNKKIQQRSFAIYDCEYRGPITFLQVNSPAFSIDSSYLYKKSIFETGEKAYQLTTNSIYEGFEVLVCSKGEYFSSSYGEQKSSTFEIIKVQELPIDIASGIIYKKLKLWILVSCNLYDVEGHKIGTLNEGKFIGEIEIEHNA